MLNNQGPPIKETETADRINTKIDISHIFKPI